MSRSIFMDALTLACKEIEDLTGSCPCDSKEVKPWDKPCNEVCHMYTDQMHVCWFQYFVTKSREVQRLSARVLPPQERWFESGGVM